jgi:hypothetical protein
VRRRLASAARLLVLPTVALLAVLAFAPGRLPVAVRIYALIACAVALGVALAALRQSFPAVRPLRADVLRPTRGARPAVLARIENEVILGVDSAFDLRLRLAPRLRALAAGLLGSRRRVQLDRAPDDARRILGEETWDLVRLDSPLPGDRQARGIPLDRLARIVDSLERI